MYFIVSFYFVMRDHIKKLFFRLFPHYSYYKDTSYFISFSFFWLLRRIICLLANNLMWIHASYLSKSPSGKTSVRNIHIPSIHLHSWGSLPIGSNTEDLSTTMSLLELGSFSSSLHRIVVVLLHTFYLLLRVSFSLIFLPCNIFLKQQRKKSRFSFFLFIPLSAQSLILFLRLSENVIICLNPS